MNIILSPVRLPDTLEVFKEGNKLTVNGEVFDFSPMQEGSTLPSSAINSRWFEQAVDMVDGEITLTMFLPNPPNYSPEQAFPVPLLSVPDGLIEFPKPLPAPDTTTEGAEVEGANDE
ncbi:hypothetical protein NLO95_07725 [Pseudomonas syringae]|nr:hypothetical protein [Pseudomonas syringae]